MTEEAVSLLQTATEAFRRTDSASTTRSGQLLEGEGLSKVIVVGDLHTELAPLRAVIEAYQDELRDDRVLVCLLGDLISNVDSTDFQQLFRHYPHCGRSTHERYRAQAAQRAYDLVLYVARLKVEFPNAIHVLAGNGELGFRSKRATEAFRSALEEHGSYVRPEVERFVDSLPLFMKVSVGDTVYLISHGGLVGGDLTDDRLKGCSRTLESFKNMCYSSVLNDDDPQARIDVTSDSLHVDTQVFGHYHLFGSKAHTEILGLRVIPNAREAYGHTDNKRVHIINSMEWATPCTYLELTHNDVIVRTAAL